MGGNRWPRGGGGGAPWARAAGSSKLGQEVETCKIKQERCWQQKALKGGHGRAPTRCNAMNAPRGAHPVGVADRSRCNRRTVVPGPPLPIAILRMPKAALGWQAASSHQHSKNSEFSEFFLQILSWPVRSGQTRWLEPTEAGPGLARCARGLSYRPARREPGVPAASSPRRVRYLHPRRRRVSFGGAICQELPPPAQLYLDRACGFFSDDMRNLIERASDMFISLDHDSTDRILTSRPSPARLPLELTFS